MTPYQYKNKKGSFLRMLLQFILGNVNILFISMCCFNFTGFSQDIFLPGYIITLKGDTVKGQIKSPKKEVQLFFKITFQVAENNRKTYTSDKIKEYYTNGFTYIPWDADSEPVFAKVICKGVLNLYEFKYEVEEKKKIKINSDFFIDSSNLKNPKNLHSGKFKKEIAQIIPDYGELVKEIEDDYYKFDDLKNIVERYNKWYFLKH